MFKDGHQGLYGPSTATTILPTIDIAHVQKLSASDTESSEIIRFFWSTSKFKMFNLFPPNCDSDFYSETRFRRGEQSACW
ncbi:hypothetical protein SprV_0100500300 [Sparganum proliferum]